VCLLRGTNWAFEKNRLLSSLRVSDAIITATGNSEVGATWPRNTGFQYIVL
jgi:hypothetical protein